MHINKSELIGFCVGAWIVCILTASEIAFWYACGAAVISAYIWIVDKIRSNT